MRVDLEGQREATFLQRAPMPEQAFAEIQLSCSVAGVRTIRFLAMVLLSCAFVNSWCADLKGKEVIAGDRRFTRFVFSGPIESGDAARFAAVLLANASVIEDLDLDSPGGDVREAMKIGEIVRAARLDTYVQPGATCASSCFFIWLNGANRAVISWQTRNGKTGDLVPPGRLGLHRPYLTRFSASEESLSAQTRGMEVVKSYLAGRFIPGRLIDAMLAHPSNEIYWVNQADIDELGESSPDLQELYVAKCGDNRRQIYPQIGAARQRGDAALAGVLLNGVRRINGCISGLSAESRAAALRSGFREILRRP
jgi:hypothetical protein